jgi:RHS repeat-associated protein
MKKIIINFLLFLFPIVVIGQTNTQNYIKTVNYKVASAAKITAPTIAQAAQNVTYFDGLGRPIQQIASQQSNSGKDIITHITYDSFGRQIKEFLPYEASSVNMAFEPNAETNTTTFYSTSKYENTTNPFSQKSLESSPLNRVLKQAAPGTSWAMGGGHEIKLDYQTNTATEVRLFKATSTWSASSGLYDIAFSDAGNYAANELYKTITYDENTAAIPSESAGSAVEFKDKEGRVILKRTYESGVKHDTYYVYDQYGNLTYVIPPKADATIDASALNGLCYQYKYDSRNRLAEKKLPGKQWEFIVYDKLDRPVATGPAMSPFKNDSAVGWLITKYDVFGRPIYTGWNNTACSAAARNTLQVAQNSATVLFETKQTSGTIDGVAVNYTNTIAPTTFKLLSVNYYDNYVFPGAASVPTSVEGQTVLANTKTLATGSWTRVPTIATAMLAEINTTFYDSKARLVRTYVTNHLGGYTYTDSKLDFTGKTLYAISRHKRIAGSTELAIREDFTYSAQDRLITHTHQINGGVAQLMADNTYDALGQLIIKKTGNTAGSPFQKVDYNYNVRGWLTEINKTVNLQQSTDPVDLFAFKINYNTVQAGITDVAPLFNGNIAETYWKTASDNIERAYGYQYDKLNRLKSAIYEKNALTTNAYNESLTYDKNGNIMSLARKGDTDPQVQPIQIDDLLYTYPASSNQLSKADDISNNTSGFNDFNKIGDDYTYDANGNMITDKNKNITAIEYNHLNLPEKITFGTTGTIEYIYNAAGQKLEKIVTQGTIVNTTNYLGGFQYKDNVLEFFPTAEGYVKNTAGVYSYVFQYKDHLGNIRVSYAKNPTTNVLEIIDENNYYPFGLKHKGYNSLTGNNNKYKYNGKELQDELGLGFYDYGARNYDPALGRWMNIDPLAEKSRRFSPYTYALNNPVYFIDPDGMMAKPPVGVDAEQGAVHTDGDGSWVYDKETTTWFGLNGAENIGNTIELNEVVIGGDKTSYVPSGDYGPAMQPWDSDNKFMNGLSNTVFGIVGTVGAVAAIPETGGASGLALTLTIGEISIGIAQMADSFNEKPSDVLHDYSTVPGLIAGQRGSEYAPLIDGVAGWIPGSMSGGNIKGGLDNLSGLAKGQNVINNGANLSDAVLDANGLIQGVNSGVETYKKK